MFIYDYALQFPNGKYYTGRVNSDSEPDAWQGERHNAFTYTESGAYAKIQRMACFACCKVVRVHYNA